MLADSSAATVSNSKREVKAWTNSRWASCNKVQQQWAFNPKQNPRTIKRRRPEHRTDNEYFNDTRKTNSG